MKLIFCFLVPFISFFAQAQNQKGISIYKEFKVFGNKIIPILKYEDAIINCPGKFKLNPESIGKDVIIYSERFEIGHVKPAPFIAFSCKWKEANVSSLQLKIRFSTKSKKNDNGFSDAKQYEQILTDEHYEGADGYKVSQLMFIDKNYTHFELLVVAKKRISASILNDLKLNFFNPYGETTLGKIGTTPANSEENYNELTSETNRTDEVINTLACPCPIPNFITRTQWNCPQGQGLVSGVGTSANVTHLIVHHSAGANTAANWNAVVLSIWNFHTGTNGYSDIGYNWLVAPDGTLYEGRGSNSLTQNVTGAHFCGTNANTMGTCMIGTYTSVDITPQARATLTKILAWKACQAGIPVIGTALHASSGLTLNRISGHRDGCATECPGTMVYNSLPALRLAVQDSVNACGTPPPPCVPSLQNSFTGCPNNTLQFTPTNVQNGGTAPVFAWYVDNVFVQNGNTFTLNNAVNGKKVFASMSSNATCISGTQQPVNSDTITVNCIVATAVVTIDGLSYCKVSPNPNNGNFNVQMQLNKSTNVQYRLIDAMGKQIFSTNKERVVGTITKYFTNKGLVSGVYTLEIYFDGKKVGYKVVVVA